MLNSKNIYFYIGSLISQILTLITSFYLLKNADSVIYGEFSFFVAAASIIGSISTLKFEQSIVISISLDDTINKISLTLQTSFLLGLVIVMAYYFIDHTMGILDCVLVLSLSTVIAFYSCLTQLFIYLENYKYSGILSVFNAMFFLLFILFFIKQKKGLEYAYLLSSLFASLIFYIIIRRKGIKFKLLRRGKYKSIFLANKSFPIYVFPGAIFSILLLYGNQIAINYIFNSKDLGLFSLAVRVLMLPSILISAVAAGIFRASLSKYFLLHNYSKIYNESLKMIKFLFLASLLIYPPLLFILYNIEHYLNIKGWSGIGTVALYLSPFAISQFFYIPLSNIALVCEKKDLLFRISLYQFILTILVYILTYMFNIQFKYFLIILSVVSILFSFYAALRFINIGRLLAKLN